MSTKKEIISLQRKWYQILKKKGFKDLEVLAPDGDFHDLLKHPLRFDLHSPERRAQERYYAFARAFNYDYKFKNPVERSIWKLHSEGVPVRRIMLGLGISHAAVHRRIKKIRKVMLDLYLSELDE